MRSGAAFQTLFILLCYWVSRKVETIDCRLEMLHLKEWP